MKLLVLDKDGTLTRTKSGHTFIQHPEDQVLIDGVAEAIAAYAADGWTIAIASNQGGVAAGFKTLEQAITEMRYAMELAGIDTAYFCPDSGDTLQIVEKHCDGIGWGKLFSPFRKPSAGMLQVAESRLSSCCDLHEDLITKRLMIGDRDEDFGAAVNAGFGYMHVSAWLEPFIK